MQLLLTSTFEIFSEKLDRFKNVLSNAKLVCIPTAAYGEDGHEDWLDDELSHVRKWVGDFQLFDIAGQSAEDVAATLKAADIVYVTGGNTYYLLEQMQKCDFADALKNELERGLFYMGSSAGAVITCPSIDFIQDMDDPSKAALDDFTGLNLVDFYIMPHLDSEFYGEIAQRIVHDLKKKDVQLIGLREDQGLYVQDNYIEVY
jgi:dipeptidase E